MRTFLRDEDLCFSEYRDFLTRSDLGSQYPKENFEKRVSIILRTRSISFSARNDHNKLIGICFGLTDFAYFLFITDLGVDRSYEKMGIGTELMTRIHAAAGGADDITVVTISSKRALGFYSVVGFEPDDALLWKPC